MQIVRFRVSGRDVAFHVDGVREVVSVTHLSAVFRAPPFVAGLMNLRGEAVPIFDLAVLFDLPRPEVPPAKVVVGEFAPYRAGFLADKPVDIVDVAEGGDEDLPDGTPSLAALDRVLMVEGDAVMVLSLERVFALPPVVALRSELDLLGPQVTDVVR
jgi:purine-binding chemotaxis protein CheW